MRLWHYKLIPYLDRQRLLGQHRECCALRGNGWGKPHSVIDYVFDYPYSWLFNYHTMVMAEMTKRGYKVDHKWLDPGFCGYNKTPLPGPVFFTDEIYREHNERYLKECLDLLKQKHVPINFEKIQNELF